MIETVGIRYCIPQVTLNKKPSGNQTFALFYRRGDNPARLWIKKTDTYVIDPSGKNVNDVYLDNLVQDADYQFSLTPFPYEEEQAAAAAGAIFSFHTAVNMTAGESPYVNKILMPGLTFDYYYSGTRHNAVPTSGATAWFYQATNNRTNEGENYYSLETGGDVQWKSAGSADNTLEKYSGFYCNNGSYIKLPNTYIKLPGNLIRGRLYAADVTGRLTVEFYLEEGYTNAAIVTCEALYLNTGGGSTPIYTQVPITSLSNAVSAVSYSIYVAEDGVLYARQARKKSVNEGGAVLTNTDTALPNSLSGGVNLVPNKWYTAVFLNGLSSVEIYRAKTPDELDSSGHYTTKIYTCGGPGLPAESTIAYAGDPASDGLGIGFGYNPEVLQVINNVVGTDQYKTNGLIVNHIGMMTSISDTDFNKIVAGYLYIPCLGFYAQDGIVSKQNCLYFQDAQFTNLFTDDVYDINNQISSLGKISFTINNAIGGTGSTILDSGVYKAVLQNYDLYRTDTLFVSIGNIKVQTQRDQVINTGYVIDFELDFDTAVDLFKSKFYTKHGSWGGYNGGVNANLVYASRSELSLIIEAHGDKYPTTGQIWGVGKEGWVTAAGKKYTGYGENIFYYADNDTRKDVVPFKQRVGCTLRTVDYFAYGKYTVRMAIPELKKGQTNWGICPALWFFHYQEYGEGSEGYTKWTSPSNPVGRAYNIEGTAEDGYYCVVNNEIDLELPSHDTLDSFRGNTINGYPYSPWDFVNCAYFDPTIISPLSIATSANNPTYRIGIIDNGQLPYEDSGRFILTDASAPNDRNSWSQERETSLITNNPNFCNCKFNTWQGEYSSGNGWRSLAEYIPAKVSGSIPYTDIITAQGRNHNSYSNDSTDKEEYISLKIVLADERLSPKGFADGKFHDWTLAWYPNHTELLVDGVKIQENWGFIPFNCMHFVVGVWFPTVAVKKISGIWTVLDYNKKTPVTDASTLTTTGTWAGLSADFESWHLKVSKLLYEPLTTEELNANIENRPTPEILYDGESFPESGMRSII